MTVVRSLKYVENYNADIELASSNSTKEKIIYALDLLEESEDLNITKQNDQNYSEPIILSNFIVENHHNIRKTNR